MESTILQIPMSKSLKKSSQAVANEYGFSSLQDLMRLVLTKLSRRELVVSIHDTKARVSAKQAKNYAKMNEDFEAGEKVDRFSSVDALMEDLRN
jgi:hypothetical protein